MQIKTWTNFSKRVNSTKQPADASATIVDVALKDMCDILAPSFILNSTNFEINYVQAFGNYYFAQCFNLDGHRTEIKCSLDHLATFKTQIGSYNGYVTFCASSPAGNIYIDDPRNAPTSVVKNNKAAASVGWTASSVGCYILALANILSNGIGGAPCYYILSTTDMIDVVSKIFDNSIVNVIEHQFSGVFNSIVSCLWLPFDVTFVTTEGHGASYPVYAGSEDLQTSKNMLFKRVYHKQVNVSIPNSLGYDGTYIQTGKYITATIYLPGVGVCPLNYDLYKDSQTGVTVDLYLDFLTGDIVYYLSTASPGGVAQTASFSGNLSAKVPLIGSSYDAIGAATGVLSAAGGIASGNVGAAASGLMETFNSLKVDTMIMGANSSPLSLVHNSDIVIETHTQVPIHGATSAAELEVFRTEQGMPYFDNATISSLSGYVQCRNASVSIPGDGAEQDVVNNYLNSGIYYE